MVTRVSRRGMSSTAGSEDLSGRAALPLGSRTGKAEIGTLLWIDEQTEAGEVDPWKETADDAIEFADARPSATPTLGEYTAFLHGGIADRGKERYVRLRAWWAGNDPRRTSPEARPLDSCEVENLRAVIGLLDEAEANDRIMKAEAFRELGEFARAEELLAKEVEEELMKAARIIRELARKGITTVEEMDLS